MFQAAIVMIQGHTDGAGIERRKGALLSELGRQFRKGAQLRRESPAAGAPILMTCASPVQTLVQCPPDMPLTNSKTGSPAKGDLLTSAIGPVTSVD